MHINSSKQKQCILALLYQEEILQEKHTLFPNMQLGVFMVRVLGSKEILVRVPEISVRQNGEPYPNRNTQVTKI